jgi:hypothetical protein
MSHKDYSDISLLERINKQPGLRERIEKLVTIAEAGQGTPDNGNDIEELIIQEGRSLQREVLQSWANNKHQEIMETTHRNPDLRQSGKKKQLGIRR